MKGNPFRRRIYQVIDGIGLEIRGTVGKEQSGQIAGLLSRELSLPVNAQEIIGLGRRDLVSHIQTIAARRNRRKRLTG